MNLTLGEVLFYGGIIGMLFVAIATMVSMIILSGSNKRLRCKLNEEYCVDLK